MKKNDYYTEMQESGQDWIGSIPLKWSMSRIFCLYNLRNEKVSDKDYAPLSVTMKGIVPQLESVAKTDNGDNRKQVIAGDFVINSRSDRRGSCGISQYDGSVSLINTVLTPIEEMDPGYYNWLFHTVSFADEFYKWGHGIVDDLWTTRWQDMKRIMVPVPPLEEQGKISAFLDAQCAQIDTAIAEAKASIEEYKGWKASVIFEATTKGLHKNVQMRDSGVEWIGEIPNSWKIAKIKHVAEFMPKINLEKLQDDSIVTFTPMECIRTGTFVNRKRMYKEIKGSYTQYADGDIVFAKVTPCFENGNACVMNELYSGIGFGSSELFVLRPQKINALYLLYILLNPSFKQVACSTMTGTGGLKRVSSAFIQNCYIPLPDSDAQNQIVNYLNRSFAEVDAVVSEKESLVVDLETYKYSLIYETVTGKRKVV